MKPVSGWMSKSGQFFETKEKAEDDDLLNDLNVIYRKACYDNYYLFPEFSRFKTVYKTLKNCGVKINIEIPQEVLDKYTKV